jgi:hypothetical protein
MSVTVHIENTYEDGHESSVLVVVDEPESSGDLDAWWEDEVYPHTGDGHGEKHPKLGVMYEATIMDAADTSLCGLAMEWIG